MAAGREDRGCRRTAMAPAEMVAMARCRCVRQRERERTARHAARERAGQERCDARQTEKKQVCADWRQSPPNCTKKASVDNMGITQDPTCPRIRSPHPMSVRVQSEHPSIHVQPCQSCCVQPSRRRCARPIDPYHAVHCHTPRTRRVSCSAFVGPDGATGRVRRGRTYISLALVRRTAFQTRSIHFCAKCDANACAHD